MRLLEDLKEALRDGANRWKGWYSDVELGGLVDDDVSINGAALYRPIPAPYEALSGVLRRKGRSWLKVVILEAKLGTGERHVALALGPTEDE